MKTLSAEKQSSMDLAERVSLLERRVKRQRLFFALAAVVFASLAAAKGIDPQPVDVIRTRSLQIVNDGGTAVGEFSAGAEGATLVVSDPDGRAAVRIEVDRHGGVVRTIHPDGRKGVELHQYQLTATEPPLTGGIVEVFDHEGQTAVALGSGVDRSVSVSMGAGYDGGAVVVFRDGRPIHLSRPLEPESGNR